MALAALWASISTAALVAPGCYGRNCDGSIEVFGASPGQGYMVDENTWASNRWDEKWLWFPGQRLYVFEIGALGGRTPEKILPYISGSDNPMDGVGGHHFAPAAGNLAEIFWVGPNHIQVKNESCSDYYLRLVLEAPPLPPEIPTADAGATGDAGTSDASFEGDAASDGGDAEAGL